MTLTYQFGCSAPGCKAYAHVTIICHDAHTYDHAKLGEAVGFRQRKSPSEWLPQHLVETWYCEEHTP